MALAVLNVPSADAALVFFVFLMELLSKIYVLVNFNVGPPQPSTNKAQAKSHELFLILLTVVLIVRMHANQRRRQTRKGT
jgi:hypothetical protein